MINFLDIFSVQNILVIVDFYLEYPLILTASDRCVTKINKSTLLSSFGIQGILYTLED